MYITNDEFIQFADEESAFIVLKKKERCPNFSILSYFKYKKKKNNYFVFLSNLMKIMSTNRIFHSKL